MSNTNGLAGFIRIDVAPMPEQSPELVAAFLKEEVRRIRARRDEIARLRSLISQIASVGNDCTLCDEDARKLMHDLAFAELGGEPDHVG